MAGRERRLYFQECAQRIINSFNWQEPVLPPYDSGRRSTIWQKPTLLVLRFPKGLRLPVLTSCEPPAGKPEPAGGDKACG